MGETSRLPVRMGELVTRRVEPEDFARIKFVSDPQVSPDGRQVAYVVTSVLLDEKRYRSRIWLVDVDRGEPVELTRGDCKDTSPRWSPDGRTMAFLSDRWGKNQIARLDLSGGEAQKVTDFHDGVTEFAWTSSGRGFLFAAKADTDHRIKHSSDVDVDDEDRSNEPMRITRLVHKADGSGFRDAARSHLGIATQSGRIVPLTAGDYDHTQPALSPCRRYLAFASNRSETRDNERVSDIWVLDLDTDSLRRITTGDGVYGLPSFSPDSRRLAFVGHTVDETHGPTNLDRLWVADLEKGGITNLTESIDREMSNTCTGDSSYGVPAQRPVWAPDGDAIFSLMSDQGSVSIVKVTTNGTWEKVVSGDREVVNFSVSDSGAMAFTASDPLHPAEVHTTSVSGNEEQQITRHNAGLLEQIAFSEPKHLPYTADDETTLDAWLLEPVERVQGVKYPIVLEIHGGPHSMYGHTFFHEFQLLAAQGYGVLYTNPRGSTGYGQKFKSAAMGDWGGLDYQDIMAGLDAACNLVDWIDTNRIGVTGGSYGGYMVNWMLTQTDRFSAAITQRSTCNRYNLFGTSDLAWSYSAWEFRGLPWEEVDFYLDRSPISYVDRVKTPVLIMHSENDLRCPIEQGEQWFTALKRLGKATEFVRFPGESHNLSRSGRPDRRAARLRWMLDWFGRYL